MIKRIEIAGIHYEADEDIQKYVRRKISKLDRYMPKSARPTAHAEVKLFEETKGKDKYSAEIILHFKNGNMTAKDSTMNMYAAVDIVEAKMRNQLKKHHDKHTNHSADRKGILRKLRSMADKDFRAKQN